MPRSPVKVRELRSFRLIVRSCELPTAKGLAQPTLPYRTSVPSPTSTISEITNFHLSTALQWHLLDLSSRHGLRPVEGFAYSKKDLRQFRNMIVDPLDKVEDRRKEQETEVRTMRQVAKVDDLLAHAHWRASCSWSLWFIYYKLHGFPPIL